MVASHTIVATAFCRTESDIPQPRRISSMISRFNIEGEVVKAQILEAPMRCGFGLDACSCSSFSERFVDFGEASEDRSVSSQLFAYFNEGSNHKEAHSDGSLAPKDVRGLKSAVLGKYLRWLGAATAGWF